jgi:molybdenum cofactor guanylyltransferase
MGRDKAALTFEGTPLWRHQLATLRATEPAELLISGANDGRYADADIPAIPDHTPGLGPLGGIATALRHCTGEPLLVLAVDMPMMTPDFLRSLLDEWRRTGKGVIPAAAPHGPAAANLEPLAAVYPRAALGVAEECLHAGERKLQHFVRVLETRGLVTIMPVAPEAAALFVNWNTPDDVTSTGAG